MGGSLTVGVVRVLDARHRAAPEHHLVLCQRARLVREYVLHLAQILGDVEGAALQVRIRLLVVKLHILVNDVYLANLHDLDGDEEGDGDQNLWGEGRDGSLPSGSMVGTSGHKIYTCTF